MNNQFTEVRTRFAPSPTGFLHVGGARTALFNYLYAKAKKGKFLLRIEDTDQSRSTEESFQTILESLKWLGINWDEGPGIGGEFGPYVQSERLEIYKKFTEKLIEEDKAYRCFCTQEELEAKKKQSEAMGIPYVYDGVYANKTREEIDEKLKQGLPYSIRFRTPNKILIIDDAIQGKVRFETKLIGDFIIVKSDGFPSYNYAVVIDDALMKISHVIRGVGHLSNTPRQVLLYEAFGFPIPKFAHVSEIVGLDGKKLSKRAGATSILAFRDIGYLPEAFRNYMSLLGWTSPDGQEYLPGKKLEEEFDIERCSKSPSTFDVFKKENDSDQNLKEISKVSNLELEEKLNPKSKLNWLSNKFIRDFDNSQIAHELISFIQDRKDIPEDVKNDKNQILLDIIESIKIYLDRLSQAPDYIAEFFVEKLKIENQESEELLNNANSKKVILEFLELIKNQKPKTAEEFKNCIQLTGEKSLKKGKELFMPIRVATTGKMHGLELNILFPLLGYEKLIQRIQSVL